MVTHKQDGKKYALKALQLKETTTEREKNNALEEVRYLASIQHPNVIAYKAAFIDEATSSLCLVTEYANGGDLQQRIKGLREQNQMFTEEVIIRILTQILLAIQALHSLRIMHRDLKSPNIFLTDDNIVKVGDLNVSKIARVDGLNYTQAGTPYYASPEVWHDQPYDFKSDVWSMGCIAYEMAALQLPFQAKDMAGLFDVVCKGEYRPIPKQYSKNLQRLIKVMLRVDSKKRASVNDLLGLPVIY